MAIFLDFVGLNTLIHEPISSSVNTIGYENLVAQPRSRSKALENPATIVVGENFLSSSVDATVFPSGSEYISQTFWLKLNSITAGTEWIVEADHGSNVNAFILAVRNNDRILIDLYNPAGAVQRWLSPSLPQSDLLKWGHFTISWNMADIAEVPRMFYNNIEVVGFDDLNSRTGVNRQVTEDIYLMGNDITDNSNELNGAMMEYGVWNIDLATDNSKRTQIFQQGYTGYTTGDGVVVHWKMGEESELQQFDPGNKYRQGDSVPGGTSIPASIGTMNLTASDNIYMTEGLELEYNVQNSLNESSVYSIWGTRIYHGDTLAALNVHRNGPYGYSSFKQVRASQNPLTRYHNKTSIFSYVLDGNSVESNGRQSFLPKHSQLRQIQESPIVTNNKPLTIIGGVSDYNRRTGKTTIERVEIQTSFNNEVQFFGDEQTNREFGLEYETHETYEDLTGLYLDGGIESDDSPLDQFELLRYQHQIYPQAGNTYLGHVRGRPNFVSGYWRDLRSNRTQISSSELNLTNGFGSSVPSQSMWPLDVEDGWATRALFASVGHLTMSSPSLFQYNSVETLADGVYMPNYNGGTYLYSSSPIGQTLRNTYDPVTAVGFVVSKKYGANSSKGTTAFYNNWLDLMDKSGLSIESTTPSINVRGNYDATTFMQSYDPALILPFYMEIDSSAHSHIQTELSHSYVHFWTKDEDNETGYIYNELDNSGNFKRGVFARNGSYYATQTTLFDITTEDGTNSVITGSVNLDGALTYKYSSVAISSKIGNEWNNKIVKFGDPVSDGTGSIKFYSNGAEISPTITDTLNFFDSNGDMRTDAIAFSQSTVSSEAWMKRHSYFWGDGYLRWAASLPSQKAETENISIGFYYKNNFAEDIYNGNDHQLIRIYESSNKEFTIELYKDGPTLFAPTSGEFRFRVRFQATATLYKEAIFDIDSQIDTLTKYLFVLEGNSASLSGYYYNTETGVISSLSTVGSTTFPPGMALHDLDEISAFEVFDSSFNGNVDAGCTFSSAIEAQTSPSFFAEFSDGDILSEIVVLNQSGSSGFDGTNSSHRQDYFNYNATMDFTSSFWTYTDPVVWYRFGNGSQSVSYTGTNFELNELIDDDSGNNRDLQAKPNTTSACIDTPTGSYENISFWKMDGPNRQFQIPLGFQTASVGEAYVLCASSSNNNTDNDYFQNAKIAEFALIPSKSTTDLEDYIPISGVTAINDQKYVFSDLTSSTVTASIWYAFDSNDIINEGVAQIENKNSTYSTFEIDTAYLSTEIHPILQNDGLETGSTFEIAFKASFVNHDPQQTILPTSTAIPDATFLSSSVLGTISDFFIGGSNGYNAKGGAGILMNSYNSFNTQPVTGTDDLDSYLSASCLYTRRHTLKHSSSFQHPFLPAGFYTEAPTNFLDFDIYQGMAQWDAPAMSGKKPFYDTYGAFANEMRLTNKDYTVIPEFKISQHVDKYLLKGDTEFSVDDNPLLEVTGGHINKWNSNLDDFYETYSTTDFLKMFDLIQEEHDDFVNPISLKLKCKGVKKFLPYKGFYPADRTVEISQQFYNSYKDYLTVSSSYTSDDYAVQNLLTPLFSPGILFNTIKSGVACDYPIMTGLFATSSYEFDGALSPTGTYHINEQFHKRIPFEALVEPEKYLANQPLYPQEPDPLGNLDMTVTWNGGGDEKYRLMVSNFLAETGEFFLRNKDFASISSLPEGDPNFGNAEAGKTYAMRIKMYRTISGDKDLWNGDTALTYAVNQPQGSFSVPQDTGSMEQAFMMYSRPSAFGPPQRFVMNDEESLYTLKFTNWADYKRSSSLDYFYKVGDPVTSEPENNPDPAVVPAGFEDLKIRTNAGDGHFLIGNDADSGYNYPFTPPYYHGDAWADVTFQANNTEKLSLSQIINSSSVEFLRFYEPLESVDHTLTTEHYHKNWRLINEDAMQIASSVNIFSKGVLKQDITQTKRKGIRNDVQVQVDTNVGNQYRWIIQSKFETPILNFNHIDHNSEDVTIPSNSTATTPIGMWHQYGELPQKPNEGVFMQVTEIPDQWIDNAMNAKSYQTGSLVELCGFSTDPVRLGDVAPTKTIKEAVVAIPFVEKGGQKRFFTIDREDIQNAIEPSTRNLVGKTIQDMVKKMKDYVFPPSMDFINNDDIDPFAMYVFEFKHTLDKQDLADIWQNLSPDIGEYHEEVEAVISHELLAHELLGGKADLKPGRNTEFELNRQVRKDKIDSKIRWMIFKVKQRAKTNYFEKIFARNESQEAGSKLNKTTLSSTGASKNASYNWPYDYFSLVELVKMDAEIDFARPDDENQEEKLVIKPYTKVVSNAANQTILNNALFGTELPEPEPPQGVIQERIPRGKKKR